MTDSLSRLADLIFWILIVGVGANLAVGALIIAAWTRRWFWRRRRFSKR